MSIDKTKCCKTHTEEKEESGECCQVDEQNPKTMEKTITINPDDGSVTVEQHEVHEGVGVLFYLVDNILQIFLFLLCVFYNTLFYLLT